MTERARRPLGAHVRRLLGAERGLLVRFGLTSVVRSLATVATVLLIEQFLAGVLGDRPGLAQDLATDLGRTSALWLLAGAMLCAHIVAAIASYDNQVTQNRISRALELRTMERLLHQVLSLSLSFFERQSHGDIMQAVRHDIGALRQTVMGVATIVIDLTVLVGVTATAVSISPRLAMWVLVVMPLMTIPLFLVARRTLVLSERARLRGNALFDALLEVLRGIRIIRVFRAEDRQEALSLARGRAFFADQVAIARLRYLAVGILDLLGGLSLVIVILVGGSEVMAGELDWAALLAFLMATRALNGPIRSVTSSYLQMRSSGAALTRIDQIMALEPEIRSGPITHAEPPRRITLDGVDFAYGDRRALVGVSLDVAAGETIGVAGPSGSGKTTLLGLLARFHDPTRGHVRWDAHELAALRLEDIYRHVSLVSQEPFLFATSARDNIRLGRPEASDAEVEAAARAAAIHDDLTALPEGYDTALGLGGARLSGGQAQRVDIARALVKRAPILLLDEATSHLDSLAERRVQEALAAIAADGRARGAPTTTFIVAHRLSTMRHADRILVLEEGRVVGFAPHEELLASCELYRRMWEAQRLEEPRAASAPLDEEPDAGELEADGPESDVPPSE